MSVRSAPLPQSRFGKKNGVKKDVRQKKREDIKITDEQLLALPPDVQACVDAKIDDADARLAEEYEVMRKQMAVDVIKHVAQRQQQIAAAAVRQHVSQERANMAEQIAKERRMLEEQIEEQVGKGVITLTDLLGMGKELSQQTKTDQTSTKNERFNVLGIVQSYTRKKEERRSESPVARQRESVQQQPIRIPIKIQKTQHEQSRDKIYQERKRLAEQEIREQRELERQQRLQASIDAARLAIKGQITMPPSDVPKHEPGNLHRSCTCRSCRLYRRDNKHKDGSTLYAHGIDWPTINCKCDFCMFYVEQHFGGEDPDLEMIKHHYLKENGDKVLQAAYNEWRDAQNTYKQRMDMRYNHWNEQKHLVKFNSDALKCIIDEIQIDMEIDQMAHPIMHDDEGREITRSQKEQQLVGQPYEVPRQIHGMDYARQAMSNPCYEMLMAKK